MSKELEKLHQGLIEAACQWTQAQIVELRQNDPDGLVALHGALEVGARLVVCAVVSGEYPQLDLCLVGTDDRLESLVRLRLSISNKVKMN